MAVPKGPDFPGPGLVVSGGHQTEAFPLVPAERAASLEGPAVFAIGNAPTALMRLHELTEAGSLRPALVIGVPVGFVNVTESKELFLGGETPYIIARGRKGGSNVAAAIVNALLYGLIEREGF